jgi:hypothetical protein
MAAFAYLPLTKKNAEKKGFHSCVCPLIDSFQNQTQKTPKVFGLIMHQNTSKLEYSTLHVTHLQQTKPSLILFFYLYIYKP